MAVKGTFNIETDLSGRLDSIDNKLESLAKAQEEIEGIDKKLESFAKVREDGDGFDKKQRTMLNIFAVVAMVVGVVLIAASIWWCALRASAEQLTWESIAPACVGAIVGAVLLYFAACILRELAFR